MTLIFFKETNKPKNNEMWAMWSTSFLYKFFNFLLKENVSCVTSKKCMNQIKAEEERDGGR